MSAIIVDVVSVADQLESLNFRVPAPKVPAECRVFVEKIIHNALAAGAPAGSREPFNVDWEAIWSAGEGAPSPEQELGRIVTAAFLTAREISRRSESVGRSGQENRPAPPPEPLLANGSSSSLRSAEIPQVANSVAEPIVGVAPPLPFIAGPPVMPAPQVRPASSAVPVPPFIPAPPESRLVRDAPFAPVDGLPGAAPPQAISTTFLGWSTFYTWMRNVGFVVVLFVAWQLWGTSISQHHEQHQLQSAFEASVRSHHVKKSTSDGPVLTSADSVVPTPPEGSVVAQLQIPTIDLSEYVVSGTAEGDLAKGPGHYVGSAAPGQAGNVAIAGHRTTNGAPFNRLGQIAIGDRIYLTTTSGERLTYIVSETPQPVSPNDVAVLDNFGDNRITLTTCNPEFSSSQRLIVVGELKQPKPPVATKIKPHSYDIVNAQTASWDWSLLPLVVLEAGVLLLLGLTNRRFIAWFGRSSRWFILIPVWGAGLYLLFGTLTTFFPATI
jgi:sortase A